MATTIQVSEKTQSELLRVVAELQARLGHRVSYDEAISMLIQQSQTLERARDDFRGLFGSLRDDRTVWRDLRQLRKAENQRLERLAKPA